VRVRVRVRVFINTQHFQNMLSLSASHPSSSFSSSSYNSSLQRRTIKSPSPIPRRQHRVTTKTSTAALSNGQKVALHYKLTNGETNEPIDDTSTRGQPVEITLGSGELFPKLEEQLLNFCKVGSKIKVTLDPEDTYGNFDEKKIQKQPILPEEMAQVKEQVQPGQVVQLAPNVIAKVVEIGEDSLTLDFNHPLAGKKLTFEVDVIAVKEAPTLFGTPMVKFTPPGQPR
tara:strand:- start:843 stop:1526 length:684 start_codon:yes stop_codon:yes gene_type:complete